MKNLCSFLVAVLLTVLLSACATTGGRSGLSLQEAIEQSAEKIKDELPRGSRVAIVAFESKNDNLSNYIMEELTGALFDRGIEVADRRNLPYVFQELNFQMSGVVSDETAKSVGKLLAADMVITGDLTDLDSLYRYRTSAINVETAIRASVTRLDVRADDTMRRMVTALAGQQTVITETRYGVSEDRTPQTAGTFLDRGIMFAMRGEYDKAIADFTEAIRLNPSMTAAYMLRAMALSASVSSVSGVGEKFSEISLSIDVGQAASAEQAQIYNRVIADFNNVIRLDPNYVPAYNGRGVAYSIKGDKDMAIADFNQAIRLDPNYSEAYNNRGFVYGNMGDFDRAITDFTQAIRLGPNNAGAYSNRGLAYRYKGYSYIENAIADYNQAIRLVPNDAESYNQRGIAFGVKGDWDRAIADFTEAIRLDPNFSGAYFNRSLAYFYKGDYDRVIADSTQAIKLNPNNADAYSNRGVAYANNGDLNRAIADFEFCLRINPNHIDAKRNIEIARQLRGY